MNAPLHIVWDWNGTLLDDTSAALAALNRMLRRRALPAIDLAFYRAHFAFPVNPFYAAIGINPEREDWDAIAVEYHAAYADEPKALNAGALPALEAVRAADARQSILSVHRQDLLERDAARYGIAGYMDSIAGTDNLHGASKLAQARAFADRARRAHPDERLVLIGDALHDLEVARAIGAACVLFGGGSHAPDRLRAAAPTGLTLADCVSLARRA